MGDNGVRSVIETNPYLRARVEELLDKGESYREIEKLTGIGFMSIGRYAKKYERKTVGYQPQPVTDPLLVRLEEEFKKFEKIQTKANYDQYHATLREWESTRKVGV